MYVVAYDAKDEDTFAFKQLDGEHQVEIIEESLSLDNVKENAEAISVFITSKIDAKLLKAMPKLKFIACRSTGFNNVDLKAAKSAGITVANVPDYGTETVAEYTFALLLAVSRKLADAIEQAKEGEVDHSKTHGFDLHEKTLGLIGCGRIGQQVAKLGRAFGMKVICHDKYQEKKVKNQTFVDLDELLTTADVVSLHVPLTKETKGMLNKENLGKMKRGSVLINTARGEIVDTVALVEMMSSGQIRGAGLDVLEDEKLLDTDEEELVLLKGKTPRSVLEHAVAIDILTEMSHNVVITAHNAYNTSEAIERINRTSIENIKSFVAGKPKNIVN